MKILDGKKTAQEYSVGIKESVDRYTSLGMPVPLLAVVLVGDNAASQIYVRNKQRKCEECGIKFRLVNLPANAHVTKILKEVDILNKDPRVHGILVQLPLPNRYEEQIVLNAIDKGKDVDGLSALSTGLLVQEAITETVLPCTPLGIMLLLDRYEIDVAGKHAVVIGRSGIVGKPVAQMLLQSDATVTIAHSKTTNLANLAKQADILIVAVGKPELIDASYVKPGAIVIDVGTNRTENGLVGDVKFEEVKDIASYITPVPGGVGPMTILSLMANLLTLYERKEKIK